MLAALHTGPPHHAARGADRPRAQHEPLAVRVDALATIVVGGRGAAALAPLGR